LLEKGLLRVMGRKDAPGRPLVYGTTRRFLEVFSLKDLSSLPDLSEIQELDDAQSPVGPLETDADPEDDADEESI
jgi:segregation and condensation protein B